MALETATYIDSLVITNPTGTDSRTTADDHLRLIKAALKRTFPGVSGEITASHGAINFIGTLSANAQTQLNDKLGLSATALTATSALYAISATNATSAVFATSASNAASAAYAFSATNATSSVFATSASNAASAAFATSATRATSAVYANSSGYALSAREATSALDYNGSVSAGQIPNASIGGQGVVELGTTAEYHASSDLTRIMSIGSLGKPLSATANGYVTLPGGILLQWGLESNVATGGTITFPTAFSGNPWAISLQLFGYTISGDGAEPWSVTARSSTNFTITHNDVGGASADWMWIAIGPV